jgi:16S rRNA (adenine1518-N6/adenine1519-N6)-dimethyltransferase
LLRTQEVLVWSIGHWVIRYYLGIGIWLLEFDRLFRTPMVSIRAELTEHGIIARKRLGQHFLVDRNILNKVVEAAGIEKDDAVLEVGSGLGMMTLALADKAKRVIAVEIDPKLAEILKEKTAARQNVEVIQKDILEIDFPRLYEKEEQRLKVVANLPYQISTPLLFRFIDSPEAFSSLTLMLQKEVAVRMTAGPGGKDYGSLSIFTQMVSDLSILFLVKPSAFFPPPKVDSAVVQMVWKKEPIVSVQAMEWFKKVVRGCFNYRRKTLINALKHSELSLPEDALDRINRIGIDPRRRPETLTLEEFARLADVLKE